MRNKSPTFKTPFASKFRFFKSFGQHLLTNWHTTVQEANNLWFTFYNRNENKVIDQLQKILDYIFLR